MRKSIKENVKNELLEILSEELDLSFIIYYKNHTYSEWFVTEENIAEYLYNLLYDDEVERFEIYKV